MSALLTAPPLWIVLVALPTLLAPTLLIPRLRGPAVALAPFAPLPLLVLTLVAPPNTSVSVPWLLLEARLAIDELGRVFVVFTAVLWILAGVSIRGHLVQGGLERVARLHGFHLLAMTGTLGLFVADDLATFYSFFTLMSFAAYGLVIHERSPAARRAARIYIVFTVLAELPLFGAILLAAAVSQDLALGAVPLAIAGSGRASLISALLLVGFGVKAGVLLLHMWMPLAYRAAPVPASAVLGGAMLHAGLFGWLRLLPLGLLPLPSLGVLVMGLGITAAFYGVGVGIVQRDPKSILAYSSLSQMGLMTLAVGLALAEPHLATTAIGAAALLAVHHGLAKGALFLGVGVAQWQLGRRMGIAVGVGLVLLSLSISGLPLTSGAIAKKALEAVVHELPGHASDVLSVLVSLSSAATLVLMLRFLACMHAEAGRRRRAPSPRLTVPWALGALLALASLWILPWLHAPTHARRAIGLEPLWSSTWPAIVGLLGVAGAVVLLRRASRSLPAIPAGDLIVPLERALQTAGIAAARASSALERTLSLRPLRALEARVRAGMRGLIAREWHASWLSGAMLLTALVMLFTILVTC